MIKQTIYLYNEHDQTKSADDIYILFIINVCKKCQALSQINGSIAKASAVEVKASNMLRPQSKTVNATHALTDGCGMPQIIWDINSI